MRKFLSLALASALSCGIAFGADNYTQRVKRKLRAMVSISF
ncbi:MULTISPECIES: hypothetical protein [Helicobacter]|nr:MULTISPECIES: hypothetical protein [Helicobacter]